MVNIEENLQVLDNDDELFRQAAERIKAAEEAAINSYTERMLEEKRAKARSSLANLAKGPSGHSLKVALYYAKEGVAISVSEVRTTLSECLRRESLELSFKASFPGPGASSYIYNQWSVSYSSYAEALDKGEVVKVEFLQGGAVEVPSK